MPSNLAALDAPSFVARLRAVKALGMIGSRAAPAVNAIADQLVDPGLRIHAIATLGKIGDAARSIVPRLRMYAGDNSEEVREAVATALFRITDDAMDSGIRLASLLATGSNDTARMRAACHLGEIGTAIATRALVEAIDDRHHGVRQQAAYGLGRIGPAAMEAIPALVRALSLNEDDGVRFNSAVAIGRIDPTLDLGVSVLLGVLAPAGRLRVADGESFTLAEKHPAQRAMAAEALGELGARATRAIPLLTESTRDHSALVREAARAALGRIARAEK